MLRSVLHFLVWFVSKVNAFLLLPKLLYHQLQTPKKCPPVYDDIYFQPATLIAQQIRNQQVKSEHVVSMYIKRAKEVNGVINAIVQDRYELALKEAQHADEFVASGGLTVTELEEKFPLLGVPITIKESFAVAGMSFAAGSKIQPRTATRDAKVVEMLKAAGAVIYAVTNTPELCMFWETMNYVTGRTRNPYDTRRTSGGSSGGEAALMATCGSLIGIGSDLVGSARIGPSFCGVYGHRASAHLTSVDLHLPTTDHPALSICPITRYAMDLPLLQKCMMTPEKVKEINLLEEIEPRQIRVYYMFGSGSNYPTSKVSSDIVSAMKNVLIRLESDGFYTKKVEIESFANQMDIAFVNLLGIDGAHETIAYKNISVFVELLRTLFCCARINLSNLLLEILYGIFKLFSPRHVEYHRKLLSEMKTEIEALLGDDGVLLYPSFPTVAPIHGKMYSKMLDTCYMGIFNVLNLPSLVIPVGQNANGLPIGVQVVAKQLNDRLPMNLARYLETSFGGWSAPSYSTPQ